MKDLQKFLASIALCIMLDPEFTTTVDAAGIQIEKLPKSWDSVKAVRKFQKICQEQGRELAVEECAQEYTLLEKFFDAAPREVPRDYKALSQKFNQLMEVYEYEQLGGQLIANPSLGTEILEKFHTRKAEAVDCESALVFATVVAEKMQERAKKKKAKITIPGFEKLSDMIGGFNPGRLVVFLADTGYGKTQANLNLAINAAKTMKVGYVNQEMNFDDIGMRIICISTGKTYEEAYRGGIDPSSVRDALQCTSDRLIVTDGKELTVPQIKAWARLRSKESSGPMELVIVDYDQRLQLNTDYKTPEWQAMKRATEELENMAKEFNCCVILVAQLNREGNVSSSHRMLYPAHTVLHFYEEESGEAVIHAKKNRHGKRNASLYVKYDTDTGRITEMDSFTKNIVKPSAPKINRERKDIYA